MQTSSRIVAAAFAAVALSMPATMASAQDCSADGPGSVAGQPVPCNENVEVFDDVIERPDRPAPDPEAIERMPETGTDSGDLALAAALALGAGGALVLTGRRRRVEA